MPAWCQEPASSRPGADESSRGRDGCVTRAAYRADAIDARDSERSRGGWWLGWSRADEPTHTAIVRVSPREDAAAPTPGPLPEQDPALPLYHDAHLW